MANAESPSTVVVTVHYSPGPRALQSWSLSLPAGSVVDDALRACGLIDLLEGDEGAALQVGIWAKARPRDTLLREHDQIGRAHV